jgi:3-phenylpropionate/trans-cinnamate dioxygenase ferredoxin reductase subunit
MNATERDGIVIVGGGLAGGKAAQGAREAGFDGPVRIVCAEHHEPYERPPLTKDLLSGAAGLSETLVHPDSFLVDHEIDVLLGAEVTAIDLDRNEVTLGRGRRLRFDRLVLATGSSPRRPPIPGTELDGVCTMRTVEDALALRDRLFPGCRLGVIGASWIGTEVAASARQRGCEVVMVNPLSAPLERVLGPLVGSAFARLHVDHGVDLRSGVGLDRIVGDAAVEAVVLSDGSLVEVDAVVLGVGVTPNVTLAERAGLAVDDGVLVDTTLQTSHPGVFAAGDIAHADHPILGDRVRLEHWANALHQGMTAGANAAGRSRPYDRIPYFFSDQYDTTLEYSGWPIPWDDVVVRGDLEGGSFVAFYLRGARVIGGINVDVPDVNEHVQRIIRAAAEVDVRMLTDLDVDPTTWSQPRVTGRSSALSHKT